MKIATTIGEMYKFTTSPAEAIKTYEGSGFKYLDYSFFSVLSDKDSYLLSDNWKEHIFECKNIADNFGFSFVQAHAPACSICGDDAEIGLTATIRSIEACGILGIRNMVIHSGFLADYKYPDDELAYFKANEPFFSSLIPAMEENNVNILFENTTYKHCRNGCYFPIYAKDLNAFVEFMNHPLFGAAWDVGHAHMDSIDHCAEIMSLGKNLKAIHVHDNNALTDQHLAPFLGTLDYDSLMQGLIKSGYDGYFTLESDCFFKKTRNTNLNGKLAETPFEVKKQALSLLYTIAKSILEAYDVYEE